MASESGGLIAPSGGGTPGQPSGLPSRSSGHSYGTGQGTNNLTFYGGEAWSTDGATDDDAVGDFVSQEAAVIELEDMMLTGQLPGDPGTAQALLESGAYEKGVWTWAADGSLVLLQITGGGAEFSVSESDHTWSPEVPAGAMTSGLASNSAFYPAPPEHVLYYQYDPRLQQAIESANNPPTPDSPGIDAGSYGDPGPSLPRARASAFADPASPSLKPFPGTVGAHAAAATRYTFSELWNDLGDPTPPWEGSIVGALLDWPYNVATAVLTFPPPIPERAVLTPDPWRSAISDPRVSGYAPLVSGLLKLENLGAAFEAAANWALPEPLGSPHIYFDAASPESQALLETPPVQDAIERYYRYGDSHQYPIGAGSPLEIVLGHFSFRVATDDAQGVLKIEVENVSSRESQERGTDHPDPFARTETEFLTNVPLSGWQAFPDDVSGGADSQVRSLLGLPFGNVAQTFEIVVPIDYSRYARNVDDQTE